MSDITHREWHYVEWVTLRRVSDITHSEWHYAEWVTLRRVSDITQSEWHYAEWVTLRRVSDTTQSEWHYAEWEVTLSALSDECRDEPHAALGAPPVGSMCTVVHRVPVHSVHVSGSQRSWEVTWCFKCTTAALGVIHRFLHFGLRTMHNGPHFGRKRNTSSSSVTEYNVIHNQWNYSYSKIYFTNHFKNKFLCIHDVIQYLFEGPTFRSKGWDEI